MTFVKILVQVAFLIGLSPTIFGTDAPPTSCVEEQVLDLFTKWREGEILPVQLPLLETITLESYEGQFTGYGIKIAFSTGQINMTGLSKFTVKKLSASTDDLFAASGTINIPSLTLIGDNYNLKGNAYVFYSLKGSGFMNVTFENVTLTFAMDLAPNTNDEEKGIHIDNISLDYSVDAIHVNLANCSWPVNKVLNAEALSIIEDYHSLLVNEATEGLKITLNSYLDTVTPKELTNVFVSSC